MSAAFYRWCSRNGRRLMHYGFDGEQRILTNKLRRLKTKTSNNHSDVESG